MADKFSVVTSFYGESPEYVHRLYSCIISQGVDWEWIVTEDFSDNPETLKALDLISSSDRRVILVTQKKKREIYIDPSTYATGDYIFHIDADDMVHPNYLSHCLYWFNRFPKVNCILSGGYFYKELGNRFSRYVIHTEKNLDELQSYVGRVWRAGHKFDWENIFSDVDDIIRMNDMFIVKSLECSGDVLCLPRPYIKYTIRENSNSSIRRNWDEVEKITRCEYEFNSWYDKNSREAFRDPFFYDVEEYINGFLAIEWDDIGTNIQYLGKKPPAYKRRKLRELFPEYRIFFGNLYDGVTKPDIQIIDCTGGFSGHTINGEKHIIVCNITDNRSYSYYANKISKAGKKHRWIKLWDYRWIISLD